MSGGIRKFFLAPYIDGNYLLKARSQLLLSFELVFLALLVILQLAMILVGLDAFIRVGRITPVFILAITVSLSYLRKGDYKKSANIFVFLGTLALIAGIISNSFIKPEVVYTTYIYFIYLPVAFCMIFCSTTVLSVIASMLGCVNIAAFFLVRMNTQQSYHGTIKLALIDSLVTFCIIFIIAVFTMRIFRRNAQYSAAEAEKNMRQNIFKKKLCRPAAPTL